MNPSAVTVHLVRHGQTDWNHQQRTQGWTDIPLNATGVQQALAAAHALTGRPVGAVISSDLSRARATAEPIAAAAAVSLSIEPALRERGFGVAEGMLDSEIRRDFAGRLDGRWTDPDFRFEGGESRRDVYVRVGGFLAGLLADPPADELVLVSHGGALRVARAFLEGIAIEDLPRWDATPFANGEVVTLTVATAPTPVPASSMLDGVVTENSRLSPP
jgi:2,3-bisphosphoglycerate-dependent phosphoglycerate mutase